MSMLPNEWDTTFLGTSCLVTDTAFELNVMKCGLPIDLVTKLQLVQNKAAQLVTLKKKRDRITHVLCRLHWLPMDVRINFKVLLMVYKALHGLAPHYIHEFLNEYQPTRHLQSSSHIMLQIPKTTTVRYGDCAFSAYGPKIWNILPLHIWQSDTISCFKSLLKTHYFKLKYPTLVSLCTCLLVLLILLFCIYHTNLIHVM